MESEQTEIASLKERQIILVLILTMQVLTPTTMSMGMLGNNVATTVLVLSFSFLNFFLIFFLNFLPKFQVVRTSTTIGFGN